MEFFNLQNAFYRSVEGTYFVNFGHMRKTVLGFVCEILIMQGNRDIAKAGGG